MAMTGAGMKAARAAAIAAVTPVQSSNPAALAAYVAALQLADSTAIVTYIQSNALANVTIPVTATAGSPSTGTGTIT